MSRKKVVSVLNENRKPLKNRRTSLNVNLSFTSRAGSSDEDETDVFSDVCEEDDDASIVNESVDSPANRNLPTKRSVSGKLGAVSKTDNDIARIKPSIVRIVRLSTSTPITAHRHGDQAGETQRDAHEILEPSENTRRSSALQNVRFPLEGEIFSPEAQTIVMETSMDITDVQGGEILGSKTVASEGAVLDRSNDSLEVIKDTDSLNFEVAQRIPHVVIPESDRDSIDTVRTSLNVNTSLDSRFSSMPNGSLYDPKSKRLSDVSENVHEDKGSEGIQSYPNSESLDGNSMANTIIITKAVIEHNDSSSNRNEQRLFEDETTIDLDSDKESRFLCNTSLTKKRNGTSSIRRLTLNPNIGQKHQDGAMASRGQPVSEPEPNPSNLNSTNSSSSTAESLHLRLSNEENENAVRVIPEALPSQPTKKKKRKLFGPRTSGLIELSPVSVQIPDVRKATVQKRKIWGKPVKRIFNDSRVVASKTSSPVGSFSEDDLGVIVPSPKKQKKIRRVKAKKIVIKRMADVSLRNRINGNTTANESCEEISLALRRTSLDDFAPTKNLAGRRSRKSRPKIIIVVTGLPIEEKLLVKSAVSALGSAKLEKIVTRHTTHVVTKGIRTVNLLRGIVRGCWLVGFEWILRSRDHGRWLDPEEYEITNLFPKAVQDNRREKQLFGAAYVSELFLTCGLIHVEEDTSTPPEVLRELVRTAGGRVASSPEEAKIIIGRRGLKEVWILDSITNGELQPIEQYCKKKNPS